MSQPRDQVVGAVAVDMLDTWRRWAHEHQPTAEEERLARALTVQAFGVHTEQVERRRDPLTFTLTDLSGLTIVGKAAHGLIDLWPSWPSWPRRTVADQLKTARPDVLIRARSLLADIDGRI